MPATSKYSLFRPNEDGRGTHPDVARGVPHYVRMLAVTMDPGSFPHIGPVWIPV